MTAEASTLIDTSKTDEIQNNTTTTRRSVLFPNVDPELYKERTPKHNPYDQPNYDSHKTQNHTINDSSDDEEWGRFGPGQTEHMLEDKRPLPTLYPHKLVNHVRVPYISREASYTWYYAFRSAVQQYGVLLIPVQQFKKNKSLCPRKYYGTKIDALRYKDMADSLYQLLALPDTIPLEHTEIRNIIHRHASNTDGYSALYEIMERIHPILNPDAKLSAPLSINCTDIHDYYNQFDSYILHNTLEHVQFSERRKVNIFLEGLDSSYAPAISQMRQQLRTWREDDVTPPTELCTTALARTVERIMQEETNFPVIRAITKTTPHARPSNKSVPQLNNHPRAYIDIQCPNCLAYGHKGINCDKLCQFIVLQEAAQRITDKTRTKLLDNYQKHIQERRNRRLKRVKGTVRQLYTDGHSQEADELWDQCMHMHGTQEDDESSTSQDE